MDIRVAVLPTVEGESIVMRLVDKSKKVPTLAELGLSDDMQKKVTEVFMRPTGALLVARRSCDGAHAMTAALRLRQRSWIARRMLGSDPWL